MVFTSGFSNAAAASRPPKPWAAARSGTCSLAEGWGPGSFWLPTCGPSCQDTGQRARDRVGVPRPESCTQGLPPACSCLCDSSSWSGPNPDAQCLVPQPSFSAVGFLPIDQCGFSGQTSGDRRAPPYSPGGWAFRVGQTLYCANEERGAPLEVSLV